MPDKEEAALSLEPRPVMHIQGFLHQQPPDPTCTHTRLGLDGVQIFTTPSMAHSGGTRALSKEQSWEGCEQVFRTGSHSPSQPPPGSTLGQAARHRATPTTLLVPCRALDTPGFLLWSAISRGNCLETHKRAIKPSNFYISTCPDGLSWGSQHPSLSQITDNQEILTLQGLDFHRDEPALCPEALPHCLPGCCEPQCTEEEHGLWRHSLDKHR